MDPNSILGQFAQGFIRHALTTAGGALASHGILQQSCQAAASGCVSVENFVGAGLVFVGIAWSWWQKVGESKTKTMLARGMQPDVAKGTIG